MQERPLRASEAACSLGLSTKELPRLVYERRIAYEMVEGIAHIPPSAIEDYRTSTT